MEGLPGGRLCTADPGPLRRDDGVKVWLNGELVHSNLIYRSAEPDQDEAEVVLKGGWNRLLVKVINDIGGHDLYLRFVGDQGSPVGPLIVRLAPPE